MSINQAVIFTKPVHHLGISLSPEELNQRACRVFEQNDFRFVVSKTVTGADLKEREVIRQHYLMYSAAVYAETLSVDVAAKECFEAFFQKSWQKEMDAGRIIPMPELLPRVNTQQLYAYWLDLFDKKQACKLQAGLIMGYFEELGAYAINAFYPSMEANFYNPETVIHYHVVEFDSSQVSWKQFRKDILGVTNASKADPESFRGKLYSEFPVEFPGRDNFIHGSAGPLEGLVERTIHEADFEFTSNPVGAYLAKRGVTLESFIEWKKAQSIEALGNLFDETEEKNTDEILQILEQQVVPKMVG